MNEELEIFKKKLLYRASYRGTKEMDILLSAFVKKHIEDLDLNNLNELENFLKFDDEIILNFYNHNRICLLYTSPSPRDRQKCRMPSSA